MPKEVRPQSAASKDNNAECKSSPPMQRTHQPPVSQSGLLASITWRGHGPTHVDGHNQQFRYIPSYGD